MAKIRRLPIIPAPQHDPGTRCVTTVSRRSGPVLHGCDVRVHSLARLAISREENHRNAHSPLDSHHDYP
jgi:hypothetical protein